MTKLLRCSIVGVEYRVHREVMLPMYVSCGNIVGTHVLKNVRCVPHSLASRDLLGPALRAFYTLILSKRT